jgi:hypothetical protein
MDFISNLNSTTYLFVILSFIFYRPQVGTINYTLKL